MTPEAPLRILDAFGLRARRSAWLIGGGGKTSLMFALAGALAAEGRPVITTTSTRILQPGSGESDRVLIDPDPLALVGRVRRELESCCHLTLGRSIPGDPLKLAGLAVEDLDRLVEAHVADHLLVEADGSAGRSLKAHQEHEPVLSDRADLVIAVIGVDCLGAPIDDAHVHRAALFRKRLGLPEGSVVAASDVAGILFHREGWLARVGPGSEVAVFINKAMRPEASAEARRLTGVLRGRDRAGRVGRIVLGDVRGGVFETA